MEFKKLVAPTLKEMFVEHIQEMILSGELTIGDKLPPERNLSESMGISRAVVNSGIVELERMGFLEVQPRVGTFIADYRRRGTLETLKAIMYYNRGRLRDEEVRSILEMRDALDKLAVECIIPRVTDEEVQLLREKVEKIKQTASVEEAAKATFDFQHELAMLSGNTLLPLIFRSFYFSVVVLWERFCTLHGVEVLYHASYGLWESIKERNKEKAISWINQCTYEAIEGKRQIYYPFR
ncbi:MAG: GntR family transcriptional regulator [Anaerovoracaceae bacterium]